MRIKFLSLQMIPWCFQVMGSACQDGDDDPATVTVAATADRTVNLIRSDGRLKIYHRPVNASELMTEFPKHLVCHSDSFTIGQKIPALSEHEELKLGHSYFLLPTHVFQSVLSFVTIASSFARVYGGSNGKKAPAFLRPFDIHKTPSGTLQIRVSNEFIEKIKEEEEKEEAAEAEQGSSRVCTTAALEKDYKQLVRCKDRQWKPKLETIRESERRRLVGGGAFRAMKRRKSSQGNQLQKNHAHIEPAPPRPYMMFISKDQRKKWAVKEERSKERRM